MTETEATIALAHTRAELDRLRSELDNAKAAEDSDAALRAWCNIINARGAVSDAELALWFAENSPSRVDLVHDINWIPGALP